MIRRIAQSKQFGVPRKLRMEYSGAIYHVMNRGDRREEIFRDECEGRPEYGPKSAV